MVFFFHFLCVCKHGLNPLLFSTADLFWSFQLLFQVDSIYNTANISLSPWVNYTFRVIAYNKIGESDPSFPTPTVCTTKDAVPDINPQNLRTIGDRKGELHIEWTVSHCIGFQVLMGGGDWKRVSVESSFMAPPPLMTQFVEGLNLSELRGLGCHYVALGFSFWG